MKRKFDLEAYINAERRKRGLPKIKPYADFLKRIRKVIMAQEQRTKFAQLWADRIKERNE